MGSDHGGGEGGEGGEDDKKMTFAELRESERTREKGDGNGGKP